MCAYVCAYDSLVTCYAIYKCALIDLFNPRIALLFLGIRIALGSEAHTFSLENDNYYVLGTLSATTVVLGVLLPVFEKCLRLC